MKRDKLVYDTAYYMRTSGHNKAWFVRKTGLCATTVKRIWDKESYQPHPSTIRMILKVLGYELVIRPRGSNT